MEVWHIDPEKKSIYIREMTEEDAAWEGIEEYTVVRENKGIKRLFGSYTRRVLPILFASQPELFSVPLEQAFVRQLAKALMLPPRSNTAFSFLSLVIGVAIGAAFMFFIRSFS